VRAGTPVAWDNHFRAGSVTKTFTAVVVLQLVAERKLRLTDSVGKWLPGLVPNGAHITIRELLHQTSGIPDYCALPGRNLCAPARRQMARRWTRRQLVKFAVQAKPAFAPGRGWQYSNTNYVLLGMIIQRATGRSLAQQLGPRIYQPLGLRQTSFPTTTAMPRPYNHGYDILANGSWPSDLTATSPTIAWESGAMVSNVSDLATFMRGLMGGRLTTRRLLRQMKIPAPGSLPGGKYALSPERYGSYGLGLTHYTWASGCGVWGHSGEFPGYFTVAFATGDGRRGAAMNFTASTLPAPAAIAALNLQHLLGCRMRFGHIRGS
jgi:D-alanyl-D-alanine carboxypeptidase